MKFAAGLMVLVALSSGSAQAVEQGVAGNTPLVRASLPKSSVPEAKPVKPLRKPKVKPEDKIELQTQETPKSPTVSPTVNEDSVQLKGVRG